MVMRQRADVRRHLRVFVPLVLKLKQPLVVVLVVLLLLW